MYLDNGHRNAGSMGYAFSWPACMSERLLSVQKHHSDFAASPAAGSFPHFLTRQISVYQNWTVESHMKTWKDLAINVRVQ